MGRRGRRKCGWERERKGWRKCRGALGIGNWSMFWGGGISHRRGRKGPNAIHIAPLPFASGSPLGTAIKHNDPNDPKHNPLIAFALAQKEKEQRGGIENSNESFLPKEKNQEKRASSERGAENETFGGQISAPEPIAETQEIGFHKGLQGARGGLESNAQEENFGGRFCAPEVGSNRVSGIQMASTTPSLSRAPPQGFP